MYIYSYVVKPNNLPTQFCGNLNICPRHFIKWKNMYEVYSIPYANVFLRLRVPRVQPYHQYDRLRFMALRLLHFIRVETIGYKNSETHL